MDVNRQAWTAGADLLVHPSERYVGLRAERAFVQKGEPIALDVIATDLEGRAIAGRPVQLRAERLDWEQVEGEWKEVPKDAQERTLDTGASRCARASRRRRAAPGASWPAWRTSGAARTRPSCGSGWPAAGCRRAATSRRRRSRSSPTARSTGRATWRRCSCWRRSPPPEGILTLRRSGLLREERFAIAGGSHTLEIRVEEGFTPNVHVQVDLVGKAPREETPAGAAGEAARRGRRSRAAAFDLPVPPASRTLALAVTPREKALAPGGETVLDLVLRDAAGRPVANGEAAVVVVDEAVLALTGYRLPGPPRRLLREARGRRHGPPAPVARPAGPAGGARAAGRRVSSPWVGSCETAGRRAPAAAPQMMRGKAMSAEDKAPEPIRARTDFSALALFAASVATDAEGRARVPVKLPDSLTRYRVMAVAVEGARRFGSGEATLVARLPLMVRPSAPRFLNFGDRFELPVVGAEPDRRRDDGGRRGARAERRAHRRGRTPPRGGRERPRRGALPDGRGARGSARASRWAPRPGRRRRGRGGAAGLDAGHHRGLRHLRADRRRGGRAAREGPGGCRAGVRRARGHDLLDRAPGPHRRGPLPRRLPLRVRRAALLARSRGGGAARRADRLPGRGPAEARGDARRR